MATTNLIISAKELEIDQLEQEEQKTLRGAESQMNMRKASHLGVSQPGQAKRPGSQRYVGSSPARVTNHISAKRTSKFGPTPLGGASRNVNASGGKTTNNASRTTTNLNHATLAGSSANGVEEQKKSNQTKSTTKLKKIPKVKRL